mmetsp:Transcript_126331/g.218899  ORF Transcript_126331/g.218899 Transcript_126331/m.218899 type:complete len:315 (+) Transcript_126331:7508-8452(+)
MPIACEGCPKVSPRADQVTTVAQVASSTTADGGEVVAGPTAAGGVAVVPCAIDVGSPWATLIATGPKVPTDALRAACACPAYRALADIDVRDVSGRRAAAVAVAHSASNNGAALIASWARIPRIAHALGTHLGICHAHPVLWTSTGDSILGWAGKLTCGALEAVLARAITKAVDPRRACPMPITRAVHTAGALVTARLAVRAGLALLAGGPRPPSLVLVRRTRALSRPEATLVACAFAVAHKAIDGGAVVLAAQPPETGGAGVASGPAPVAVRVVVRTVAGAGAHHTIIAGTTAGARIAGASWALGGTLGAEVT